MVLKCMLAMLEQRNRNYFSLWIANSVNIPWLQLWQPRLTAQGFNLVHFLSGVIPVGKYEVDTMILTL